METKHALSNLELWEVKETIKCPEKLLVGSVARKWHRGLAKHDAKDKHALQKLRAVSKIYSTSKTK